MDRPCCLAEILFSGYAFAPSLVYDRTASRATMNDVLSSIATGVHVRLGQA
jgi:hypothetical protein